MIGLQVMRRREKGVDEDVGYREEREGECLQVARGERE